MIISCAAFYIFSQNIVITRSSTLSCDRFMFGILAVSVESWYCNGIARRYFYIRKIIMMYLRTAAQAKYGTYNHCKASFMVSISLIQRCYSNTLDVPSVSVKSSNDNKLCGIYTFSQNIVITRSSTLSCDRFMFGILVVSVESWYCNGIARQYFYIRQIIMMYLSQEEIRQYGTYNHCNACLVIHGEY